MSGGVVAAVIGKLGPTILTLALLSSTAYVIRVTLRKRHVAPGPPRLPILGNIFQLPPTLQFVRFTEWAQEYGSFFSLDLLGQHVFVINSHKVAMDLLERRSTIYSDRPRMVMVNEILTQGIELTRYGDLWRRIRRASHSSFNAKDVRKFEPFQTKTSVEVALRMLDKPFSWERHLDIFAVSTMFTSVYGRRIGPESPVIKQAKAHIDRIVQDSMPGHRLCELLPFIKTFPTWMAPWKKEALEWHDSETKLFEEWTTQVSEASPEDPERRGFAADLMEKEGNYGLSKKETAWLAGSMLGVGSDTTSVALANFILAMNHYPDVMLKAQRELDEVVGRERPPSFEDMPSLPYIRAIVKETLRWRPIAPLALHGSTDDDWYEGYFIPKGTIIIANIWTMNRDPQFYPDFDVYRPERFLDETGKCDATFPNSHRLGHVSFGFSRRNCIGQHFANQSLFIAIATMLWSLDIKPAVDAMGKLIIPSKSEWHDEGLVIRPKHFDCQITARFPEAQAILEASAAADM